MQIKMLRALRVLSVSRIQAGALVLKVTPHFGQRISSKLMRRISPGVISCPQCGQGVARDAFTFSRLIFLRAGIWEFYSGANLPSARVSGARHSITRSPLAGVCASSEPPPQIGI